MPSTVDQLEREFATQFGFAGSVATGFGRAALLLALETIDVRDGDVLLPNFVCAQVTEAITRAGGKPIFYPVKSELSVRPPEFGAALTPETRAAIAVHYYGRTLPSISAIAEICNGRRVPLIEDCALAFGAHNVGKHCEIAAFSLTKSDWCYGGGLLAARSKELLERAKQLRDAKFRSAVGLTFLYGLLRRADYLSNRPARSRVAETAGRALERFAGLSETGFYDAGCFDTKMTGFAVRRARRLLAKLPAITARRRRIVDSICESLGPARRILPRPESSAEDSCAFLLLKCEPGKAIAWRERAARAGIALRHCWPAYQLIAPAQTSTAMHWLAENFLILEIHPRLTEVEVQRIVDCLKDFAA